MMIGQFIKCMMYWLVTPQDCIHNEQCEVLMIDWLLSFFSAMQIQV